MRSIRFLIPYFGEWPTWFPLYLETCAWNPTIEWFFFTDCPIPRNAPANVVFEATDLKSLSRLFSAKLDIPSLKIDRPYKLCDFKPAYGFLFEEYLYGIDHWAHGDIDVVYGDLRSILTPEVLQYNIVSLMRRHIAGHLTVYRNTNVVNHLFRKVPEWEDVFADSRSRKMDETLFTSSLGINEFQQPVSQRRWDGPPVGTEKGYYFVESWSTPRFFLNRPWSLRRIRWRGLSANKMWRGQKRVPNVWYWKAGRVTNNVDNTDLPYFHFMHWNREEWRYVDNLVHGEFDELRNGFRIESLGFFPLRHEHPGILEHLKFRFRCLWGRLNFRVRRLLNI